MYPAEVSFTTAEDSLDLLFAHSVKVVRHRDLARHETEPPYLGTGWSAKGRDFYDWFTGLSNNERLALCRLFYEFRELRFRLVNIHCFHWICTELSLTSLVYHWARGIAKQGTAV